MHERSLFPKDKNNKNNKITLSQIRTTNFVNDFLHQNKDNLKNIREFFIENYAHIKEKNIIYILEEIEIDIKIFIILYEIIREKKIFFSNILYKKSIFNSILVYSSKNKISFEFKVLSEIKKIVDGFLSNEHGFDKLKRLKSIIKQEGGQKFIFIAFEIFLRVLIEDFTNIDSLYKLICNLPQNNEMYSIREIFKVIYKYLEDLEFKILMITMKENSLYKNLKFKNIQKIFKGEIEIKDTEKLETKPSFNIDLNNKSLDKEYLNIMKRNNFFLIYLFYTSEKEKYFYQICFKNSLNFECKVCKSLIFPLKKEEYKINLKNLKLEEIVFLLRHKEIDLSNKQNIETVLALYFNSKEEECIEVYLEEYIKNAKEFLIKKFLEIKNTFKFEDYKRFIKVMHKLGDLKIEIKVFEYTFSHFNRIFKEKREIEGISDYFYLFKRKEEIISACMSFFIKSNKKDICNKNKTERKTLEKINNKVFSQKIEDKKIIYFKDLESCFKSVLLLFKYENIQELIENYEEIIIYKLLKNNYTLSKEFYKYLNNGLCEILHNSPQTFNSLNLVYKEMLRKNAFDIFSIFIQKENFDENMLEIIIENYKKEREIYLIPLIFHLKNNISKRRCVYNAIDFLISHNLKGNISYISSSIIYFFEKTKFKCSLHKNKCIKNLIDILYKQNIIKEIFPYFDYTKIKEINYTNEKKIEILNNAKYKKGRENSKRMIFYLKYDSYNKKIERNNLIDFLISIKKIENIKYNKEEVEIEVTYEDSLRFLSNKLLNNDNLNSLDGTFYCLQEFSQVVEELNIFKELEFIQEKLEIEEFNIKRENIERFKKYLRGEDDIEINIEEDDIEINIEEEFYADVFNFVCSQLKKYTKERYDKLFLGHLFERKIRNEFLFQMISFLKDFSVEELKEFIKEYINLECEECILKQKKKIFTDNFEEGDISDNFEEGDIFYGFFHKHIEVHNISKELFFFLFKLNQYSNTEVVSYYDLLIISIQFKLWKYSYLILYNIKERENIHNIKQNDVYYSYLLIVLYFLNELEDINNLHIYLKKPTLFSFLKSDNKKYYLNEREIIYLKKFSEYDSFGKLYIKEIYKKIKKIKEIEKFINKEELYEKIKKFNKKVEKILKKLFKEKNFQYEKEIRRFVYNISLIYFIRENVYEYIKKDIEEIIKRSEDRIIEKILKWYMKYMRYEKAEIKEKAELILFVKYNLFRTLIKLKKNKEAEKIIDKLLKEQNYDAFYLKSLICNSKEEKLKVLQLCENFKPSTYFSSFIIEKAKLNNTLKGYENALNYEEIDLSEIYYLLGKYYEKKKKYTEVYLNYEKCLKINKKYLKELFPQLLFLFCTEIYEENIHLSDILSYLETKDLVFFFTQIISKISHKSEKVGKEIISLIIKLMNDFPIKTMWNSIQYLKSTNKLVNKRMNEILKSINKEKFNKILELSKIFKKIAKYPKKETSFKLKEKFPEIENYKIEILMTNRIVQIKEWMNEVKIYNSLKRPKRIGFIDENGNKHFLLCKDKEDLRKDQKCMEFFNLFNSLSDLNIKTYLVIPFDNQSGILEMVDDIKTIKSLVRFNSEESELIQQTRGNKKSFKNKLPILIDNLKPRLKDFFIRKYKEPDIFYERLNNFIKSYAVMCGVGWFIGLGDRHCDNIAIEMKTGQTLHVDINLIFEKGKKLPVPEKVPFRLTKNLRDCFFFDTNGLFRKTLERTISLLKENKELVLNNMLAFVFDPLFENNKKIFDKLKDKLEEEDITDKLIEEAIDMKNLGDMFVGWASYI